MSSRTDFWLGYPYATKGSTTILLLAIEPRCKLQITHTLEHLQGGLGQLDENTIVDLEETKELQRLAFLRVDLVDTLDTHDEGQLGLFRDVQSIVALSVTGKPDLLPLGVAVFFHILLSTCEDDLPLLLALLCGNCQYDSSYVGGHQEFEEGDLLIPERWLTIRQH